ncbi:uncharacterized protein F5Z01DRAFT_706087 [Emericellopsis atlantica]|uniref:F-box domain-containing protein n=1 Tax=Emericellopsis atlantica TaxID=2614577 RepID=A0A9P8CPK0_9HYPO|nr:uncharacterized protein F5Z01DRAFT_706087 [Emericellopsis atlantica]KAG9254954.1 hypothetical protein F5Z01DRAFT_706087 [Emericellopsis atlantica]
MSHVRESSSGSSTPFPILEEDPAQQPRELPIGKGRNRQRLLRGLQRVSSVTSLNSLSRGRSHSAPYRPAARGTLSCVSLAATGPPTPSNGYSSPLSNAVQPSSARPSTPANEFPFPRDFDVEQAARPAGHGQAVSTPGTAPLPLEARLSRPRLSSKAKTSPLAVYKAPFKFWDAVPHEIRIYIFSFLQPKQLVQASRVSRSFHKFCFDGQLWMSLDASKFYQEIPADSLARIITSAGPFIKDLNLRGCVQVEHYKRAEVIVKACKNLMNATLEGCRNFQKTTLHSLLESNERLVALNLTGLTAVSNRSCRIIAESCPQLESLNVSWCGKVDSRGIKAVIEGCTRLRDLRAGEVRGFDNLDLAEAIFRTNKLERLILSGCAELDDGALRTMMHGVDPEIDVLTDRPVVPARKLRHLDVSRCARLTNAGISSMGHLTPDLEGLQLSRCRLVGDAGLEPILASAPRLTHLELEDLEHITNVLLSEHLAKAPCARTIEHLSLSYCEHLSDTGLIPLLQNCVRLRSVDLDNTRISDLTLTEAALLVTTRSQRTTVAGVKPQVTLKLVAYDCQNVTWTGIREVLFRNAETRPVRGSPGQISWPTETVALKCFYGFQQTIDEHQKRVLQGDFAAANKLERKWADYMQAVEEAGVGGSGRRRRRRRAREAQALHLNEEDGLAPNARRRARTMGSCFMM